MASKLTINFANDIKFARDLDEVAEAWNYSAALLLEPTLTKQEFVEKKIKENFQAISKQSRTQKAIQQIVIEY